MDSRAGIDDGRPAQRWRLILRRPASDVTQRDHELAWESALDASGLRCVRSGTGRRGPRIGFAVPLPLGVEGAAELAEITLTDRLRSADVRAALTAALPAGVELVDLHDVWLGEPGLPSLVVGAEYRIELPPGVDGSALRSAVDAVLGAAELPRVRGGDRRYDLRPLIAHLAVEPPVLRARLRHDPTLGTGRPDELLAELGERLGSPLTPRSIVRERLVLAGDEASP